MNEFVIVFSTLLLITLAVFNSKAADPPQKSEIRPFEIVGTYLLPNGLIVELFQECESISGKIIDTRNYNESKDINNPEKNKRDQPLIGMTIITGLRFDPESITWKGGRMYAPDKGMTLNLRILSTHPEYIQVEGSRFLFTKQLNWKKIKRH